MNTPAQVGGFALGLAAVFAAAIGVGTAVGPVGSATPAATGSQHAAASHADTEVAAAGGGGPEVATADGAAADAVGGLMVSERGFTLELAENRPPAGDATPVAFRIRGADGDPVTAYDRTHDEDLHFIAVRRDMTGFQHVHPELAGDGTWSTPLDLTAGDWRVFADFTPSSTGEKLTLGADVAVAGEYTPQPLPGASTEASVDGYAVTLDGDLVAGQESELTLSVSRDGQPVTDLQPYLAAYGHLVVLRDGDLAYLHVHPAGEPGDGATRPGPDITFYATAPSAGDYRLFLDFQHDGVVRTAEFTARATDRQPSPAPASDGDAAGHGHD